MTIEESINAVVGKWRDGLFDCFSLGACQSSLCCIIWCPALALARVMSRMKLTWYGEPVRPNSADQHTFCVVIVLVIIYLIFAVAVGYEIGKIIYAEYFLYGYEHYGFKRKMGFLIGLYISGTLLFLLWMMKALVGTRQHVREQYFIPEGQECWKGYEDLCLSCFCTCCVISQIDRHTGDYDTLVGPSREDGGGVPTAPDDTFNVEAAVELEPSNENGGVTPTAPDAAFDVELSLEDRGLTPTAPVEPFDVAIAVVVEPSLEDGE